MTKPKIRCLICTTERVIERQRQGQHQKQLQRQSVRDIGRKRVHLEEHDLVVLLEVCEAAEALGEAHDEVRDEHHHARHRVQERLCRDVSVRVVDLGLQTQTTIVKDMNMTLLALIGRL